MKKSSFGRALGLCLLCYALVLHHAAGQVQNTSTAAPPKVIPPSPNVAALGKYGDIPVSPYSGVPNISIPLYTIQSKDITVPVSISYHASGIKVHEEAGRAGLGWAINAGGVISRSVMGGDDFTAGLPYHTTVTPMPPDLVQFPVNRTADNNYIQRACRLNFTGGFTLDDIYVEDNSAYDFQPDQYSYNFLAYSGKFMLTRDKQAILAKQEKMSIRLMDADANVWQVKTPDGMTYRFAQNETYMPDGTGTGEHKSAWHLSSITSPLGETVTFNYTVVNEFSVSTIGSYSELRYEADLIMNINCGPSAPYDGGGGVSFPPNQQNFAPRKTYTSVFLSSIDFTNGQVRFEYGTRTDLAGDKKLEKVEIYKKQADGTLEPAPFKEFVFGYGYFVGTRRSTDYIPSDGFDNDLVLTRLKLQSLTEKGIVDGKTITKPPHEFNYYGEQFTSLPGKTSLARDHWGYHNGRSNASLVPSHEPGETDPNKSSGENYVNAAIGYMKEERNTSSNPDIVNVFGLKRITYPTKGWTEFTYEPHQYDPVESRSRDYSYFGRRAPYVYTKVKDVSVVANRTDPATHSTNVDLTDLYLKNGQVQVPVNYKVTFRFNDPLCTVDPQNGSSNCVSPNGSINMCIENMSGQCVWASSANCGSPGSRTCTTEQTLNLVPGIYTFKASFPASATTPQIADIQVFFSYTATAGFDPKDQARFSYAGGLRIARITDHDGFNTANDKVTTYNYNVWLDKDGQNGPEEYSAGKLMAMPQYSYIEPQAGGAEACSHNYLIRTSDSNVPLNGSAGGSVVGYDQVTVLYGQNGRFGKTVYQYENLPDKVFNYDFSVVINPASNGSPQIHGPGPSRPPVSSTLPYERNGLLKMQSEYKNVDGTFVPVKQTENDWFVSSSAISGAMYFAFEKRLPNQSLISRCDPYIYFYPAIQSNWTHLNWVRETVFDESNAARANSVTSFYTYEGTPVHFQPIRVTKTSSATSKIEVTSYTYPADYTAVTTGPIAQMRSETHFMHNAVVETARFEQEDGAGKLTGGTFTTYEVINPTGEKAIILPTKVESLHLEEPKSSFASSLSTGQAADPDYNVVYQMKYNTTTGNLAETNKASDVASCYLWGYNNAYPVAEIKNATYQQVKAALGVAPDAEVDLGAGGLTAGQINTLRTHALLKDAMITTFAYDPLKGITSQTGPDGVTLAYKYDELGRLVEVKDHLGNLVKHYEYHYKQ